MMELWATEGGGEFGNCTIWVRREGEQFAPGFAYPTTVSVAFGLLRDRGLDVESLAVSRGNRIRRLRSISNPNPKRRAS